MPWQSVADLKKSETFAKSETLRKMPEFRLRRFVQVFNAVHSTKVASGASSEEAESAAFALAYAAARRFQATPEGAKAEEERHYASTMAPVQFSMGGEAEDNSFEWLMGNLPAVNAAIAGNAFNLEHDRTDPLGIVRRILPADEVPADARATLPKGAPFAVEFSYFDGTPDDLRKVKTVSAEWLRQERKDGRSEVIFPDSFAVTEDPATDQSLGVGIAKAADMPGGRMPDIPAAVSFLKAAIARHQRHEDGTEPTTPESQEALMEDLEAALSALAGEPEEEDEGEPGAGHQAMSAAAPAASAKTYQEAGGSGQPEIHSMPDPPSGLEAKVASLSAALADEQKARKDAETKSNEASLKYAALKEQSDNMQRVLEELKAAALDKEAEDAALKLAADGKIATDAVPKFAARYKKLGKEEFEGLAADLPRSHIGIPTPRAAASVPGGATALDSAIERMSKGVESSLKSGRVL